MKIVSVSNPFYSKVGDTSIDCTITFDDGKTYPYTAVPNDSTDYGKQLWIDLNYGKYGAVSPVPQSIIDIQTAANDAASLPDLATQVARLIAERVNGTPIPDDVIAAANVKLSSIDEPTIDMPIGVIKGFS